ncbi:radical SAM protein [Corallococcus caeni]|nr:radical SAM protein [Corallococcus sp. KH5-1]
MLMPSTYNVVVPLKGNDGAEQDYHVLFNTLAGTLDVIDGKVATALKEGGGGSLPLPPDVLGYLDQRGYYFESRQDEVLRSRILYDEMMRFHRQSARQPLVVIPSYNCDLKCPYCWQRLYHMDSPVMSEEMANHLFEALPTFLEKNHSPDKTDLIIFGGEPLQDKPALRARVLHLLELGRRAGYSTKAISNGVGLAPNVPYLKGNIDVIQVTIDGPAEIHNKRRPLPGRRESFAPMIEGIARAVDAGIHINVRVNTDMTNLYTLPELSEFAQAQPWFSSGLVRFHLAPVKNHNPRKESPSESDLLLKVLELVGRDERMSIYDLSGFPGIKYFQGFKDSGLFSPHRFFNCEAQINFFAFDLHGDVYACWDTAGLKHLAVGSFSPEVKLDPTKLGQWRKRTALDIAGCQPCPSSPHCGGGCQFLALEHKKTFLESACDSMMEGYVQAIQSNANWLLERARAGDHAVGLVTAREVVTPVTRLFGLADSDGKAELIGCA